MTWYLWNMVAMHHDIARRCPWMPFPFMARMEHPWEVLSRIQISEILTATEKFKTIVRTVTNGEFG